MYEGERSLTFWSWCLCARSPQKFIDPTIDVNFHAFQKQIGKISNLFPYSTGIFRYKFHIRFQFSSNTPTFSKTSTPLQHPPSFLYRKCDRIPGDDGIQFLTFRILMSYRKSMRTRLHFIEITSI